MSASTGPRPVVPGAVVLLGATGRTGIALVERAASAGILLRAVVRDPSRLGRFAAHPSVRVVQAPINDARALEQALTGCCALISAIGPVGLNPRGIYSSAAEVITQSMKRAGVRRLLFVTSSGHEPDGSAPLFFRAFVRPVVLRRIYADMARAERIIEDADLEWTIVRPSMFVHHDPRRSFRVRDRLNPEGGWKISREHAAAFMLEELLNPAWIHRHPAIAY